MNKKKRVDKNRKQNCNFQKRKTKNKRIVNVITQPFFFFLLSHWPSVSDPTQKSGEPHFTTPGAKGYADRQKKKKMLFVCSERCSREEFETSAG